MWVFISSQIRRWVLFAIVVPLLTTVIHIARTALEKRNGETRLTKALMQAENLGRRQKAAKR